MNYTEVTNLALNYADKANHAATVARIDDFLRIVEARINRFLKTSDMSKQATLSFVANQNYYGLPVDFGGLRDIQTDGLSSRIKTLKLLTPEQINNINHLSTYEIYYTILAKQLRIHPAQDSGSLLITYYQKVAALDSVTNTTNWISDDHPDAYTFGLLVEISSFNKDATAKELWDTRFKETLEMISIDDQKTRWSGNALQSRPG